MNPSLYPKRPSPLPLIGGLIAAVALTLAAWGPGWSATRQQEIHNSTPPPLSRLRAVVTPDDAYQIGSPEMLLSPFALPQPLGILPNPQGRYALIQRSIATNRISEASGYTPMEVSLSLYDSVTGHTRPVFATRLTGADTAFSGPSGFQWLSRTNSFVYVLDQVTLSEPATSALKSSGPLQSAHHQQTLMYYDADRGSISRRAILTVEEQNFIFLYASPTQPYVIAVSDKDQEAVWTIIDGRGRVTHTFTTGWGSITGWNETGTIAGLSVAKKRENGTYTRSSLTVDVTTGVVALATTPLKSAARPPAADAFPLRLVATHSTLPAQVKADAKAFGATLTLHPLYLEDATSPVSAPPPGKVNAPATVPSSAAPLPLPHSQIVAPDADQAYLLADMSAVLYIADGAVYAAPVTRISRARFDAELQAALKTLTIANAKQVALSVMMYAQDNDETFPPAGDISPLVGPYLRDQTVLVSPATGTPFTYTLNGEKIAQFSSVSTTVMGYLTGPGGRAVVYADGHVKWEEK